jgi:aryl-phospho-beta-D-glucosidase BglC (GH1 family)
MLDLHWTHHGTTPATGQQEMPNREHSIPFWTSVSNYFKNQPNVIFDVFNEPYPDRATSSATEAWKCYRDGGSCPGLSYSAAGMQDIINAIR